MKIHLAILLVFGLFSFATSEAGEYCTSSNVWCYECQSAKDAFCKDPFTAFPNLPTDRITNCKGCCMKYIVDQGTPQENIVRTCTGPYDSYLREGCNQSKSLICYCKQDGCNGALALSSSIFSWLLPLLLVSTQLVSIFFRF